MSDLFTVVEHEIAQRIQQNASTLTALALAHNDIGLYNMLNDIVMMGSKVRKEGFVPTTKGVNRQVVTRIAEKLSNDTTLCLQLAQNLWLQARNKKPLVNVFKGAVDKIKQKLGIQESLDMTRDYLKRNLNEANGDKKIAPPSEHVVSDKEEGDILYHLDIATRHIDVLVDFKMIHGHEDEIMQLSSQIQDLAQRLRSELEARRTPYDERNK